MSRANPVEPPAPLHLTNRALEKRAATLRAAGVLRDHELLVIDHSSARHRERDPEVLLAFALAVRAPRVGHVGVDLLRIAELAEHEKPPRHGHDEDAPEAVVDWPADPREWQARVLDSSAVALRSPPFGRASDEVEPDRERPFVAQETTPGHRLLMTRRMWVEQEQLARGVRALLDSAPAPEVSPAFVDECLPHYQLDTEGAAALRSAAAGRLTLITGGPGTGKTYSIKRMLALLLRAYPPGGPRPLRVELAAPTGKAAVRMGEAITEELDDLPADPEVREVLAELRPRTLHKLLGMRPDGTSRHNREKPIEADVIVVDEVSMVDLVLMRRLVQAVAPGARLILLGDRDQLASVEAGTVLSDLVGGEFDGDSRGRMSGVIVRLSRSYRFAKAPAVSTIARGLQRRDDEEVPLVRAILCGEAREIELSDAHISHLGPPRDGRPSQAQLESLAAPYIEHGGYAALLADEIERYGVQSSRLRETENHLALLAALDLYRVLAVHRRGPLGVSGLEHELSRRVRAHLSKAHERRIGAPGRLWASGGHWIGRPLIITRNSYDVGLMNGDIGLVLPGESGLTAVFPRLEKGLRGTKEVALSRLPPHQGALAMTVHKSQGSQFERVALVLAGRQSPIQTRELIYTGITRTRTRIDWLGEPDELEHALKQRVQRASGLAQLL